jgi:hypothetical protein
MAVMIEESYIVLGPPEITDYEVREVADRLNCGKETAHYILLLEKRVDRLEDLLIYQTTGQTIHT